jgi:hypothetical protein
MAKFELTLFINNSLSTVIINLFGGVYAALWRGVFDGCGLRPERIDLTLNVQAVEARRFQVRFPVRSHPARIVSEISGDGKPILFPTGA